METKFSKGPWRVRLCDHRIVIAGIETDPIAELHHWTGVAGSVGRPSRFQSEANAHLIAASPTMYSALEKAARRFREYEQLHMAKGSIDGDAKARSNCEIAEELEALLLQARGGAA